MIVLFVFERDYLSHFPAVCSSLGAEKLAPSSEYSKEEIDFGIASDNEINLANREWHETFHKKGNLSEVIEAIAKEIEADKRADGWYDLYGAVSLNLNKKIETSFGELRVENDGILVIVDSRFQKDHAGRGELAVYARNEAKAQHELTELRAWKDFAIEQGIASEADITIGHLGKALRQWMNDVGIPAGERARRVRLIATKIHEFHQLGIRSEQSIDPYAVGENVILALSPEQLIIQNAKGTYSVNENVHIGIGDTILFLGDDYNTYEEALEYARIVFARAGLQERFPETIRIEKRIGGQREGGFLKGTFIEEIWISAGSFTYKIWVSAQYGDFFHFCRFAPDKESLVGRTRSFPLDSQISIGREGRDYSLPSDRLLSGRHFVLWVSKDYTGAYRFRIVDAKSLNGTRVEWNEPIESLIDRAMSDIDFVISSNVIDTSL